MVIMKEEELKEVEDAYWEFRMYASREHTPKELFIAGVEWQREQDEIKNRWIPIKEMLPPKRDERYNLSIAVNLKTVEGDIYVGHYNHTSKNWLINGIGCIETITHWRAIDL